MPENSLEELQDRLKRIELLPDMEIMAIRIDGLRDLLKLAIQLREIQKAVKNDSLASDGMEMIQSAMREDEILPVVIHQCKSRVGADEGVQCELEEGHEGYHLHTTTSWNDPMKTCWIGPTTAHRPHHWTEDKPGGKKYFCPGSEIDRT